MANFNCNNCNSSNSSNSCNDCNYCNNCNNCNSSNSCNDCNSCNSCNSCYSCDYCNSCNYSRGLRQSEKMAFCLGSGGYEKSGNGYHKLYCAWNKEVGEARYNEILESVKEILKDFKLDARNSWAKEWSEVTPEQWAALSAIPEFDLEITKQITGLDSIPTESKKIEIDGKKFTLSELKAIIAKAS